jgi:hypothetical protein
MVGEYFPLMASYTGVSAICDYLQVTSDPQLALPVSEVVQRKFMESGRILNLKKYRIVVHPDSALVSALQSPLRPTAQNCLERPSAQSRFGQILSRAECQRLSLRLPPWNAYHPRLPGRCFASVSMSA